MGTGIVAVAAASLPEQFTGLRTAATVVWGLAAVAAGRAQRGHRRRTGCATAATARGHALDPVMAHFYGAPPMAMLTVGAGTLLLGRDVIGLRGRRRRRLGALAGRHRPGLVRRGHRALPDVHPATTCVRDSAFGGWLMPVVPPMVSASTGALLVPLRAGRPGPADAAAGLLRDVRAEPARLAHRHHADLVPAGRAQDRPGAAGADAVDRAGTAGPVDHRRQPAGRSRAPGAARALLDRVCRPSASSTASRSGASPLLWAGLAGAITVRTARGGAAVLADLVVVHLPGRHLRHRHHRPRPAHGLGPVPGRSPGSSTWSWSLAWLLVAVRTAKGSLRGQLFLPPAAAAR